MNNNQEIWKDIKGYEDKYQVSNLGNVRNKIQKNNYIKIGIEQTTTCLLN